MNNFNQAIIYLILFTQITIEYSLNVY